MATKPSVNQTDWVEASPGQRVEPSGSRKNTGFNPGEPLPAQSFNWLHYSIDQWIKYLEFVTDEQLGRAVCILGTAAQVTAGQADFSDPQDAYDFAEMEGGSVVIVLEELIEGDLDMDSSIGIYFIGLGLQSVIKGQISVTGNNNKIRDIAFEDVGAGVQFLTVTGQANEIMAALVTGDMFFKNESSVANNNYYIIKGDMTYKSNTDKGAGFLNVPNPNPILDDGTQGRIVAVRTGSMTPFSFTLPAPREGAMFTLKDVDGMANENPITISAGGGVLLEGIAQEYVFDVPYGVITFGSDGTSWFVV